MIDKRKPLEGFNEQEFIDSFRSKPKTPSPPAPPPPPTPPPESDVEPIEVEEPSPPKREEKPRGRKSKMDEYRSIFFERKDDVPSRFGKTIAIRRDHHRKIQQIVQIEGEDQITIFNYIDNVLEHHLKHYDKEMSEIYNNNDLFNHQR